MSHRSIWRHCAAIVLLVAVAGGAGAAAAAGAADVKAPDKVKSALSTLAYVQADMASKLPNKAYARLPHENQEFQEAAPALADAVADEPAAFKAKVGAQLKRAQAAASNVAEISKSNDEARITAAVAAVASALKPLNEMFPVALRPVPGQLTRPGSPGAGGPPPDLR